MQLLVLFSFLCFFVNEIKTTTLVKDDLIKKTNEYVDDCVWHDKKFRFQSDARTDEICALYLTYSQVNKTEALEILGNFLDQYIEICPIDNNL